ncbi:hypothetical protein [Ammoniphilus sp. 3BR4]
MLFSIGSMIGPGMAGMGIQYIHPNSLVLLFRVRIRRILFPWIPRKADP